MADEMTKILARWDMSMNTPKRKIQYMILTGDKPSDLTEQVELYISDGWKLLGGVACSASETADYLYTTYAQAMIKDGDE